MPKKMNTPSVSSVSFSTRVVSPGASSKSCHPASSVSSPEGFKPAQHQPPTLTPNQAPIDLQEPIDDAVVRELERRLSEVTQSTPRSTAFPTAYGPPAVLYRPALTIPGDSSWDTLDVLEPVTFAPPPSARSWNDEDLECDEEGEDEQNRAPPTLNEVPEQSYHFDGDFHTRGHPAFAQAALSRKKDPSARRSIAKRYHARIKRANASEDEQRALKWRGIQRRAAIAAHQGRVRNLFPTQYNTPIYITRPCLRVTAHLLAAALSLSLGVVLSGLLGRSYDIAKGAVAKGLQNPERSNSFNQRPKGQVTRRPLAEGKLKGALILLILVSNSHARGINFDPGWETMTTVIWPTWAPLAFTIEQNIKSHDRRKADYLLGGRAKLAGQLRASPDWKPT